MARTFYKTTFTVEVLSEEPLPNELSLSDVYHEITDGDWSGDIKNWNTEEVDAPTMAKLLEAQGSSPAFFELDETGFDFGDSDNGN